MTIFDQGNEQSIMNVLSVKDKRQAFQRKLLAEYPGKTIVAIKLNIPGPIKNNSKIKRIFNLGMDEFLKQLADFKILFSHSWHLDTGEETFLVMDTKDIQALKLISIKFEDEFNLGRLFDIDILSDWQRAYSRKDLGFTPRKCLICDQDAKNCARSRKHSIPEMQTKISEMYENYGIKE
ncbi:citrate lyase holo-[acyl-carrier protein] synthase [Lentilactobacillus laojiaonis]|uniref:citrate lyase holo-[acyl-carrier protein] synthase n=1 Tax=Lentilactobacillus laojiaonis TaxID=2883998 RepID=UPI001D0AA161|nr:citrate lyase holo-[acyl-carrier protein] synthase [Lentilactobacillus laojiaonis]UDM32073.1 citrate lyase holo-[acyl-carrier protein] synthase [Lentilactobacillus laojiaonis]